MAGRASWRDAVPIEPVGQATSAIIARRALRSSAGWRATKEWSEASAKTAGAIRRQASQSMQVRST